MVRWWLVVVGVSQRAAPGDPASRVALWGGPGRPGDGQRGHGLELRQSLEGMRPWPGPAGARLPSGPIDERVFVACLVREVEATSSSHALDRVTLHELEGMRRSRRRKPPGTDRLSGFLVSDRNTYPSNAWPSPRRPDGWL